MYNGIIENINNNIFKTKNITIILDNNNTFWFCVDEISNFLGYNDKKIYMDYINHRVNKNYIKTLYDLQDPDNIISKSPINNNINDQTIFINKMGMYQLIIISRYMI